MQMLEPLPRKKAWQQWWELYKVMRIKTKFIIDLNACQQIGRLLARSLSIPPMRFSEAVLFRQSVGY